MADAVDLDKEYHFAPLNAGDYDRMKELFLASFGVSLSHDQFLKRYDTSGLGSAVIGFIAIHTQTGMPAAYYGVFPVKIIWKGRVMLSAQSGDTMTHPDHRKKGLFIRLARMTYEKCMEMGIELVFGLPNENSYPGFINRLGWKQIDQIVRYDLKLSFKTLPLPKWSYQLNVFHHYILVAKKILAKNIRTGIKEMVSPQPSPMAKVWRDEAYLIYKNEPDKHFIEIDGILIWLKLSDVLWIGELSDYEAVNDKTIHKLKQLAFLLGYNTISFHYPASAPPPGFLSYFKKYNEVPSCFVDLSGNNSDFNILLTAADFDTW
jgi:hypothetical protein